jgi:heptaprenyl diphosphate synthase
MENAGDVATTDAPVERELIQLQEQLDGDLTQVRARLRSLAMPGSHKVHEPIMYAVEHVGRLFRPTLVLASSYLVQKQPGTATGQDVIDAATAVELLHIATLCHDDLIDDALVRRGIPTTKVKFGSDIALLTGDYLLACCMRTAASLGVPQMTVMSETLIQACVGQIQETSGLFDQLRTEQDYLSAISGKTAYLMRAATMMGAMQPGVSAEAQDVLANFGHNLGMAFQIWDDILDLYGKDTGKDTGKELGKDLLNGVYTLPILYAFEYLPDHLLKRLREKRSTPRELREMLSIITESGAIDRAAAVAQGYVVDAVQAVKTHPCFTDRARAVEDCLLGLIARLAPRHPALQDLHVGLGLGG